MGTPTAEQCTLYLRMRAGIMERGVLDLPNMVVRFDNGSFMLCEDEYSTYEELRMNYAVEVVGNIYEHPELIK